MHDLRASDGKNAGSWQDLHLVYPPATICRAFRIHGAHLLPKPAHFGCMAAICCHEPAFFLSEVPSGIHQSTILPSPDTQERISRASCRCRTAENASRTCAHTRLCRCMRLRRRSRGGRRRRGHAGVAGGRGTAGGTARGARGGRGAALARRPLSTETVGRRHALRRGGTAAAGGRSHGMGPARTCAATGRSRRRWRARLRDAPIGGGQHQLRGQLRREGTNEPVHSNIFPLRYSYQNYLLCNK